MTNSFGRRGHRARRLGAWLALLLLLQSALSALALAIPFDSSPEQAVCLAGHAHSKGAPASPGHAMGKCCAVHCAAHFLALSPPDGWVTARLSGVERGTRKFDGAWTAPKSGNASSFPRAPPGLFS